MSLKNEARYAGSPPLSFDRQPSLQERRRSSSPEGSRGHLSYERFPPDRGGPAYRGGYSNTYRPDSWRQAERPYYNGPYSPPPERYANPVSPRSTEQDPWTRPVWRAPEAQPWLERRQPVAYDNGWPKTRPRDTMAAPMFEPSDNWKQTHGMSSEYQDGPSKEREYTRFSEVSPRGLSPDRTIRYDAPQQPYSPTDRFRRFSPPQEYHEPYPYSHMRTDSGRSYTERGPWSAPLYTQDEYASAFKPNDRTVQNQRGFPGRNRRRNRTTSGGSFRDGSTSPIRTRTNLPDRLDTNGRFSPQYSPRDMSFKQQQQQQSQDSYSVSPVSHVLSRSRSSSRSSRFGQDRILIAATPKMPPPQLDNIAPMAVDISETTPVSVQRESASPHVTFAPGVIRQHLDEVTSADGARSLAIGLDVPTMVAHEVADQAAVVVSPKTKVMEVSESFQESTLAVTIPSATRQPADLTIPATTREPSAEPDIPLSAQHGKPSPQMTNDEHTITPATPVEAHPPRPETPPGEPIPLSEALRMVVAMRLRCDPQTREQRVEPILCDNKLKTEPPPKPSALSSPKAVVKEVMAEERVRDREASLRASRPSLEVRFAQRQADLNEKVARLKDEYLELHERWLVQCGKLDEVARTLALQEAAATAGRTTRRSAATMGDAVRTDLEMEQIIASLGNEELTDANLLGAKNAATIPDMITVTTGEVEYYYDDTNNEIENPSEFYVPHTRVEDWADDEINTLIEKFSEFPKQFGIIADFLPNKTAAECVSFYYLHKHKHLDFRKAAARRVTGRRRRGGRKQKSNALLADIIKHDEEVNASTGSGRRKKNVPLPTEGSRKSRRGAAANAHTPTATPTPEPDAEPRKRKRRAVTRYTASAGQEENHDGEDGEKPAKRTRRTRKPKVTVSTPVGTPGLPDDASSTSLAASLSVDQVEAPTRRRKQTTAVWSDDDKALFLRLLAQYGDQFKRIAASMPNKTTSQVTAFYKANVATMELEKIAHGAPKRSPTPDLSREWPDGSFSKSGTVTPSISVTSTPTPAEPYPGLNFSSYPFDAAYRMNGPPSYGSYGAQYAQGTSTQPSSSSQYYSTAAGSQYGDAQARQFVPIQPRGDQYALSGRFSGDAATLGLASLKNPSLAYQSSSASSPPPATLRTTFQSAFPFSSLSPASFAARNASMQGIGGSGPSLQGHPSEGLNGEHAGRTGTPGERGNASMAFDATPAFTPPPQMWTHAPLQNVADLAAYLEHRTRLSGQQ